MILDIKSPSTFIASVSTISKRSKSIVSTKLKIVAKDGFLYFCLLYTSDAADE